jgi:multidrug resistance efflux pump
MMDMNRKTWTVGATSVLFVVLLIWGGIWWFNQSVEPVTEEIQVEQPVDSEKEG